MARVERQAGRTERSRRSARTGPREPKRAGRARDLTGAAHPADLARQTIGSITVLGALQAPAAVKAALADRIS